MSDFETRVLPVVKEWARKTFGRNETLVNEAIGLCWFRYDQTPTEKRSQVAAEAFAWFAIKQIKCGRNVPLGKGKAKDAMAKGYWQAAAMVELADRKPGPERIAEARETVKVLLERARSKPKLLKFLRLAMEGLTGTELAARLQVTPARVSQLRREAMELAS
jgi:hypothetical protein